MPRRRREDLNISNVSNVTIGARKKKVRLTKLTLSNKYVMKTKTKANIVTIGKCKDFASDQDIISYVLLI